MTLLRLTKLAASLTLASCQTNQLKPNSLLSVDANGKGSVIRGVKTTAYTESESDHLVFGNKTAAGGRLQYGNTVRSAAADWSVYPVGTVFKIEGDPHSYEVDDYGSALVGTGTIDIYKPSKAAMREYGARHVNIEVLKWGSKAESLAIMKPRKGVKRHVDQMIAEIEQRAPSTGKHSGS